MNLWPDDTTSHFILSLPMSSSSSSSAMMDIQGSTLSTLTMVSSDDEKITIGLSSESRRRSAYVESLLEDGDSSSSPLIEVNIESRYLQPLARYIHTGCLSLTPSSTLSPDHVCSDECLRSIEYKWTPTDVIGLLAASMYLMTTKLDNMLTETIALLFVGFFKDSDDGGAYEQEGACVQDDGGASEEKEEEEENDDDLSTNSVVDLTTEDDDAISMIYEKGYANCPDYFPSYVTVHKSGGFRVPKDLHCIHVIEIADVDNENLFDFLDWLKANSGELTNLRMVILSKLLYCVGGSDWDNWLPVYIQVVMELENVKSLKSLHINQCYFLSHQLFTAIEKMTQLEAFSFTNYEKDNFDDGIYSMMTSCLCSLTNLRRLDLSFFTNDETDWLYDSESLLLALRANKKLEYLKLYASDMSLSSMRKLPYLPCLKVLNLGRNRIDDVAEDQDEHDADQGDEFQKEMYGSSGGDDEGRGDFDFHDFEISEEACTDSDSDDDDDVPHRFETEIHPRGGYTYNQESGRGFLYIARRCPALETLDLSDGVMNRERVDFLIPALSMMKNLKELYLHNNASDLPHLDYWRGGGINSRMLQILTYHLPKSLKVLTLYGNDFVSTPMLRRYLPPSLENDPFFLIRDHDGDVEREKSRKLEWFYTADKICEYVANGVVDHPGAPINALGNLCANEGCLRLVIQYLQNCDYCGCVRNWLVDEYENDE